MSDNKNKKSYLNRYIARKNLADRIEQEIETIRARYTAQAIKYNGMPKALGGARDLSDYAAEVEKLLDDLQTIQTEMIKAYKEISRAIERLPDGYEKEILRLRYLHGMRWRQIADGLGFTERRIYQIHGNALELFRLPKGGKK